MMRYTAHLAERQVCLGPARHVLLSERFACKVARQHRTTQRHSIKLVFIDEAKLRRRLREIADEHIRWGRRMAYRVLRRQGWPVNHKRVHGLWREEGFNAPP